MVHARVWLSTVCLNRLGFYLRSRRAIGRNGIPAATSGQGKPEGGGRTEDQNRGSKIKRAS
jgi:hypothetical protein